MRRLKTITKYDGEYRRQGAKHPVIERFWRVMAELSEKERAAVVGFSWGRSRLPPAASVSAIAFNIDAGEGGDDFIPTSSTCDFRLHLPQYTSDEALKSKLLYACSVPAQREAVEVQRSVDYGCGVEDEEVLEVQGTSASQGGMHCMPIWRRMRPKKAEPPAPVPPPVGGFAVGTRVECRVTTRTGDDLDLPCFIAEVHEAGAQSLGRSACQPG